MGDSANNGLALYPRPSFHPPSFLSLQAAAVALVDVRQEDNAALDKIKETAKAKFADNVELRRRWGGGVMGLKTIRKLEKRKNALEAEAAKKAML